MPTTTAHALLNLVCWLLPLRVWRFCVNVVEVAAGQLANRDLLYEPVFV